MLKSARCTSLNILMVVIRSSGKLMMGAQDQLKRKALENNSTAHRTNCRDHSHHPRKSLLRFFKILEVSLIHALILECATSFRI